MKGCVLLLLIGALVGGCDNAPTDTPVAGTALPTLTHQPYHPTPTPYRTATPTHLPAPLPSAVPSALPTGIPTFAPQVVFP